ncbi:hypothetical protein SAMN06265222_105221 [Neorhodopirellula lusitana]|uniref:HEPN domain-containing protein n=1 Tax=Neorhodopirellula lusitana TaxID=445327 RepID=A0ABY1Q574_9BACT|nr:hypothetical protein SAMN06265222_105221 [Neorhodopirellula lusitana]
MPQFREACVWAKAQQFGEAFLLAREVSLEAFEFGKLVA